MMARAEPPRLLQVVREPINAGADAAYEEIENEIATACVVLKCPHPHLALETLTSPREIWWLNFFATEEQRLQVTRAYESNRPLMDVLIRNSERKSHCTGPVVDQLWRYRPDLGGTAFADLLGARYAVVSFGEGAIDARGPVFENADGLYFAVQFFRTLADARQHARRGATLLGFHPSWGLPAQDWIDADREFWSVNPAVLERAD